MCNKLKLSFLSLASGLVFFFSPLLYAQPIFNFKAPATNTNVPSLPNQQINQVMSPSDFKNTVNQLGKQNLNDLSEQVTQQIVKAPQPPNKAPAPMSPPGSQTAGPTSPPPTSAISAPPDVKPGTPGTNEVYTGFNFENSNSGGSTGTTAPSNTSSGGWDIKY